MFVEGGAAAIQLFIMDPEGHPIPTGIRRSIRLNQALLPQAGTTSMKLALHILTTSGQKTRCITHYEKVQRSGQEAQLTHLVNGVYGEPILKDSDDVEPASGVLHCGCSERAACWEFFWWKTWTAHQNGYTEPMPLVSIRAREFFHQNLSMMSGLRLEDVYCPDGFSGWLSVKHQLAMRQKQLANLGLIIAGYEKRLATEKEVGNQGDSTDDEEE